MARKFQYPQDVTWTQRSGEKIRLGDMEDSHIANVIRMLRRSCDRLDSEAAAGYSYGGNPDSMGSYYAEQGANQAMDESLKVQRNIEILMDELRRRYPDVRIHVRNHVERLPVRRF